MEQTICKELAVFFDASSFEIQTICVENAWSLSVNYGKLLIVINFAWIYCYMHVIYIELAVNFDVCSCEIPTIAQSLSVNTICVS